MLVTVLMDRDENTNHDRLINNHNEFDRQYENLTPDMPATVDRRAPQLNEANDSSHCSCPCARGAANGDGNEAGGDVGAAMDLNRTLNGEYEVAASDTSSDYGDEATKHDEGVEEHLIEVGDFGLIPLNQIMRSLAQHHRCTCHHGIGIGILPHEDDYPYTTFNSPAASGLLTPGDSASMIVEASSGSSSDQSMASSQVLSISSRGSSLLEAMGGAFAPVPIFRPLSLTPEFPIMYRIDIDISEVDFTEFDMW
ncbi:hypothetical protein M409DRAFT_17733 [Zasmidium cellare ATCC 36951]|uniref:Uncharacterized protein n=1 Tax=Zasmidium cellare ATCC 36951 TaxID=1080233 RepID=A0A6A6D304_ZASCE|nr:uncharacterized protein M409DRAFT_17733 [Zasmidium cellare ATCC 36951]KAF2172499.1 hypothetical protein M409DRAFT_17733 [Zasmidium cellare ATCC 36951]